MKLGKYEKGAEFSYAFGAFVVMELLKNSPFLASQILIHSKLKKTEDIEILLNLAKSQNIEIVYDDKLIEKLADKENVYIVGVFSCKKALSNGFNNLNDKKNSLIICNASSDNFKFELLDSITLVNPSDMGNMGTIMRTLLGFGYKQLNIILPAVDIFNPKVIRASMGALFSLKINLFDSVEQYLKFDNSNKFAFMLDGTNNLNNILPVSPHSLIFGNEASGLPSVFKEFATTVVIKHSKLIDSLNLPNSTAIAMFKFKGGMFN